MLTLDAPGVDTCTLFAAMARAAGGTADAWWLDSADLRPRHPPQTGAGPRFSLMAAGPGGPLWRKLLFSLPSHAEGEGERGGEGEGEGRGGGGGRVRETGYDGACKERVLPPSTSFWDVLEEEVEGAARAMGGVAPPPASWLAAAAPLPPGVRVRSSPSLSSPSSLSSLPFLGGWVGYLGYELKAQAGGRQAHRSGCPDAAFFFADRFVCVDHAPPRQERVGEGEGGGEGGGVTVAALLPAEGPGADGGDAAAWVAGVVRCVGEACTPPKAPGEANRMGNGRAIGRGEGCGLGGAWTRRMDGDGYGKDIDACQAHLVAGESYEICLTNRLSLRGKEGLPPSHPPLSLYAALRANNPAPYACFFDWGRGMPSVCCSSPERFLRLDRGGVLEAKPIKGTARRWVGGKGQGGGEGEDAVARDAAAAEALRCSAKDRAENLMIVDLLRNDLGMVAEPGSVHVPRGMLMRIESFATVHQMVSTVRAHKRSDATAVQCVRAAFPPGSMTGAPKVRTMELIDALERDARGVYSGAAGFFSAGPNGQVAFDLNVVIRTAVLMPPEGDGKTRDVIIGAGGAITVQSDTADEMAEVELKAEVIRNTVRQCGARA